MTTQRSYEYNSKGPFGGLMAMVMGVLFIVGLFYVFRFVFNILWWLMPIIIIATAIIDHKVIIDYAKWIAKLFKKNILTGLVASALTFFCAPVVSIFLLGKAAFRNKVKTVKKEREQREQGEFVNYEEVESEILDLPTLEEKPQKSQPEPQKKANDYDEMFE